MKRIIILTVFFLNILNYAQNTYNVQPGVKNNQIVLQLSNISLTEAANNLEVKLIKSSNNLRFNQTEMMIENITKGTETEAAFTFDIDYNIGKTEVDTIEFLITDLAYRQAGSKSIYQTKQFILQYSVPTEYKLEQNYPNPFPSKGGSTSGGNPTTKIRYSIPNAGIGLALSVLKVYDILGNEVATLVNEQKESGYYEVEFNASHLASGVYIYKLQSSHGYSEVKKMLLLK